MPNDVCIGLGMTRGDHSLSPLMSPHTIPEALCRDQHPLTHTVEALPKPRSRRE